jgi:aspartyl/asparaginyl beta-hydroxylase (cupin superfamily)
LTKALVKRVPGARGFAFSRLAAGAGIKLHRHSNPFVTGALTLVSDGAAAIEVSGVRHPFVEGRFVIFDYRLTHSVLNSGRVYRIVLLVLLDNRDRHD